MSNALLSYVNLIDAAATTLTASHETSPHTVDRLSSPIIGRRWRTETLTAHATADFGSDVSIDVVALRFPRDTTFPTTGNVQHQFDPDGGTAGAGATHDSAAVALGAVDGYGYHLYRIGSTISARYWRFTFSGVSGVSFIDVGRAWAGEEFRPERNISYDHADAWNDLSRVSRNNRSGAEFVDTRPNQRNYSLALETMPDSDRQTIRELKRTAGVSGQILFVSDPDDTNLGKEICIGRLQESTPIRHPTISLYATTFNLLESL